MKTACLRPVSVVRPDGEHPLKVPIQEVTPFQTACPTPLTAVSSSASTCANTRRLVQLQPPGVMPNEVKRNHDWQGTLRPLWNTQGGKSTRKSPGLGQDPPPDPLTGPGHEEAVTYSQDLRRQTNRFSMSVRRCHASLHSGYCLCISRNR